MRILLTLLLLATTLFYNVRADNAPPPPTPPPSGVLDLKFTAVDGRAVDLSTLRGKVVLIDFWATWCPDCRAEVPNVVAAYNKYHDQGLEIVGVSFDTSKDKLTAFTAKNGMSWPQYFDGKKWDNAVGSRFQIHEIPTVWLVDKTGHVVSSTNDTVKSEAIEALLKGG